MQIIKKIKKLGLKLAIQKFIGYEAIFSCAFCEREFGNELYKTKDAKGKQFVVLPHSKMYWYADPLLWEQDGKEIVFLERVDRKTGRGCIACADITNGQWEEPIPIIEERFHMSFPMCFLWEDELYMIPETEMGQAIFLYRCVEFPYKWEKTGEFLKGNRLVDSVIWEKSDHKIQLVASEYNPENDFYTRYYRYELYKENNMIMVKDLGRVSDSYSLSSRMAGPIIEDEGLAIAQRSTAGIYGFSVQFCQKGDIVPEECVKELLPTDIGVGRKLLGIHTYSQTTRYEIIDIQYLARKVKKWRC